MCARVCLCLNSLSCDVLAFQTATKPPSRDSVVPVCPVRRGHVHRGRCFILTARVLSAFQYAMCALCVCPPFGVLITSCMFLLLVFCLLLLCIALFDCTECIEYPDPATKVKDGRSGADFKVVADEGKEFDLPSGTLIPSLTYYRRFVESK